MAQFRVVLDDNYKFILERATGGDPLTTAKKIATAETVTEQGEDGTFIVLPGRRVRAVEYLGG